MSICPTCGAILKTARIKPKKEPVYYDGKIEGYVWETPSGKWKWSIVYYSGEVYTMGQCISRIRAIRPIVRRAQL